MSTPSTRTWVEISRSAIEHNLKQIKHHVSPTAVMAVVKSNAYGHGLVGVAWIADHAGADWFGVDNVDEGLELRRTGIKKPILILGYTLNNRLAECVMHDLSLTVYNLETLRALSTCLSKGALKKKHTKIHIKIETGTSRQGIDGDVLKQFIHEAQKNPRIVIEGMSTHYANIEDTSDHRFAEKQLERFEMVRRQLGEMGIQPRVSHTACSAATILFPETHFNLVRLGIALYGLWPSKETLAIAKQRKYQINLKPALTWKTRVAQVKQVSRGTPVSYGLTERMSRDSRIAVLPVGYWDGFPRSLSSTGSVLIHGRRCKVVGRICMNMCMVDVTDVPRVLVEDEAVLIGTQGKESITAEDNATKMGTINYEVVTRINPTLPRLYV